jgi:predicted dienelactone hydrolase
MTQSNCLLSCNTQAYPRRSVLVLGAALTLSAAVPYSYAQSPATEDEIWTDPARNRAVPALIRWPAQAALGIVVFSHGMGGAREGADVWGKAWSSAGFVVLHLQHHGSDSEALRGGFGALRSAMAPEQLLARVADIKFAIDEIDRRRNAPVNASNAAAKSSAARWHALKDLKIGVSGHSFGARSTQAVAGMAYPHAKGWTGADPRVAAFLAFSPALGKGTGLEQAKKESAAITHPFMVVTGSLDGEVLGNGETPESRRMVFDALPAGHKALLWLDGADHFTFAGNEKTIRGNALLRRDTSAIGKEAQHHPLVARVTAQWWKEQLSGASTNSSTHPPASAPTGLGASDIWLRG